VNRPLRIVLIGLVLLDLGFVHITDAARATWLLPLALLTVLSPLLIRLRDRFLYRLAWNGAVVAVFSVLVHHATSGGVRYLLEDGLLLAALCQVHLLNNIGPDQKPDLLFFNSFLVPVVTCFLSLDLAYLILFTAYAPLLLLGLSLHVLAREGRPWSTAFMLAVGRGAAARAAVVMALTLIVFFLAPRDFHRKGLLGRSISFQPGLLHGRGYTEEIDLESSGMMGSGGDRIVMTVKATDGSALDIPEYWRGATLGRFDGREWHPLRGPVDPNPWTFRGAEGWARTKGDEGRTLEVDLRDTRANRLFLPPSARGLRVAGRRGVPRLAAVGDTTMMLIGNAGKRVRYQVTTGADTSVTPADRMRVRREYHRSRTGVVPSALTRRARDLRRGLGPQEDQHRVVSHLRSWLEREREYLPPGAERGAKSLTEFAAGDAGAHCEFFATALALMLRSEGIPARFVAGYRSIERGADDRTLIIRDRHAHAWVEVFDPGRGWYTVDATPEVDLDAMGGDGPFAAVGAAFRGLWDSVTGFNGEGRSKALSWLRDLPAHLVAGARNHPVPCGVIAVLLVGLLLARRRKPREPRVIRDYRRVVRRAGLASRSGETPRELLTRARLMALRPKKLERVVRVTEDHEAARYAVRIR